MAFNFIKKDVFEQKMLSWASVGLLIFVSAFLWSPSRDGLQGIYYLAFFLPMLSLLLFRIPKFNEYGGWMTLSALIYAGFSALSSLWSTHPKDIGFFIFQWFVLAVWLCGSSLLFVKRDIDIAKYLSWFVILGAFISVATIIYYYGFVFVPSYAEPRLYGWNVFRNPNEIGAMCGVIALFALTLAWQSTSIQWVSSFYLLVVAAGVGLVTSFSRGALAAFLIMAIIALIIIRPPIKVWLPPLIILLAVLIFFIVLSHFSVDFGGRGIKIGERSLIWSSVLEKSRDNIFTGIGMTKNTSIIISNGDTFNHAHNAWLDTFYRTGLIGLLLVVWHLSTVIKTMSCDRRLLPLYLWLGYGCICDLFDSRCFFWEIGAKWFFYWIPIGLIIASLTGIAFRASHIELEK